MFVQHRAYIDHYVSRAYYKQCVMLYSRLMANASRTGFVVFAIIILAASLPNGEQTCIIEDVIPVLFNVR